MSWLALFLDAMTLRAGYNAALVALGAALLGFAAGGTGAFLFLRKRALVSDAIAHATLPGVGLAFLGMVALGMEGRSLPLLLAGSAITAFLGLLAVQWMVARTRLTEDAAIGAVLSVFFGFGVVLLTVIQTMPSGRQAGLEGFLLGSTAGMLFAEGVVILVGSALAVLALLVLRRPLTLVAFDAGYARGSGWPVERVDLAMMGLVLAVAVIGLKIVGLILIVAMLIIPAATARFWTERVEGVVLIAALLGALAAYMGAALSASAPDLPTGPIIVLVAAAFFAFSMAFAPERGVLAAILARRRFQIRVHRRQGLLAMARGERILEPLTMRVLRAGGLIRADGVPTEAGRGLAAKAQRDEARWDVARRIFELTVATHYDGLTPIEDVLTEDEIAEIDREIGPPRPAT